MKAKENQFNWSDEQIDHLLSRQPKSQLPLHLKEKILAQEQDAPRLVPFSTWLQIGIAASLLVSLFTLSALIQKTPAENNKSDNLNSLFLLENSTLEYHD